MEQYLCSIPNPGVEGAPKILRSGDPDLIARWIKAEDRPGRSIYELLNPLKPGATTHGKDNTGAVVKVPVDLDFKNMIEAADEIDKKLADLLLAPTELVDSGHGRHVKWELKEPIPYDDPDFERVCALQATLTDYFVGDRQVRPWSLLRRPGTTNSKAEPHVPCRVMRRGAPVDLTELESFCDLIKDTTLFTRKPAPEGNGQDHYEAASTDTGPVNVEAELVAMGGGKSANAAQIRIIPSMLRRGEHPEDVLTFVVDETLTRVGNPSWTREVETAAVIKRILSGYKNLLLANYDPASGEIPQWLPGEFHQRWAEALEEGKHPSIGYNRGGFYVRAYGAKGSNGSKIGIIRDLLLRGTTWREILDATGWKACSVPDQARQLGLRLEQYEEDGVTHYKGIAADIGDVADEEDVPRARMPPPRGDARAENSPPHKRRFKLVAFNDLRPGPEPLYLVDELIPIAGMVDVWGKAKCYKSFWCLDLMLHVAMGWEYRDRGVRQGAVVYCAFEGAHGYKKRIEGMRRKYNIEDDTNVPLYVMPGQANLIAEHGVLISDIREQLGEVRPAAVVLDTLNKSLHGSENKDVDMGAYVRAAEKIRDAFNCVVIIVHHCGYDDTRPRGHSSLPGAVDAQLAVTRTEEVVTVTVEMMRDGPEDTQVVSEAEVIEVGQDQNGKTLTTLVMTPSNAEAATHDQHGWPRGLQVFHRALKDALATSGRDGFQPEAGVLPVRAVGLPFIRDRFYATYAEAEEDSEKRNAKLRQAFNRALGEAQRRGTVKTHTTDGQTMLWLPVRTAT